ncbi:NUDIX hydrolase [Pseudoalteromonas sp. MEBiC 03607]|uniref:NUDIX hydrolase n=1 Tax=Pseudoalteromonas sp. MEBiC 03607 TaxID=2563601 RepID=UPI0010933B90|nr:NUDIX hydrolase [Pseudoalteromonas sp. MEBiC 03607]TGV20700.1 NUDIX hydrolase [Pseudoalteromonas sp. MEBiC 03607]
MHKPNVTVAAIVTCEDKFLLVKERDKHTGEICYNQPAGHLEANETLAEAACRELIEETGISLNASHLVGIYNLHAANGFHYMRFSFAFTCPELYLPSPQDNDILSADWFSIEQIRNLPLRSPLVLKCIEDHLAGQAYPLSLIYQ